MWSSRYDITTKTASFCYCLETLLRKEDADEYRCNCDTAQLCLSLSWDTILVDYLTASNVVPKLHAYRRAITRRKRLCLCLLFKLLAAGNQKVTVLVCGLNCSIRLCSSRHFSTHAAVYLGTVQHLKCINIKAVSLAPLPRYSVR